jgi:YVTN family beta-propeller protein
MFDLIGISAGEDAVWVLGYSTFSDRAAVFRIDPRTNAITATIPVSSRPWGVAVGEGGVWVASAPDHTGCQGTLSRIDPRTNRVVAKITVGYSPLGVAVGGGSIWVPNSSDGTISRIDPGTNQVVTRIVADSAKGLAFSEQKLWGIDSEFRVREFQLSPLTEQGNAQAQFTRE